MADGPIFYPLGSSLGLLTISQLINLTTSIITNIHVHVHVISLHSFSQSVNQRWSRATKAITMYMAKHCWCAAACQNNNGVNRPTAVPTPKRKFNKMWWFAETRVRREQIYNSGTNIMTCSICHMYSSHHTVCAHLFLAPLPWKESIKGHKNPTSTLQKLTSTIVM